jgi:DNA polymerase
MVALLESYQNLALLQNLYRLEAIGFQYIDHFNLNTKIEYETPNNISELSATISSCHLCDLSKSRKQSMVGYGSFNADLLIIDYSVSQTQDSTNSYYTGRSGEILKNMIENVLNLNLDDIYITHAIKCKPLNSNKPSPSEYESCKTYLLSQIKFIQPKVIVTLGVQAYKTITGDDSNFENIRGHIINFNNSKLIPIYHPSHLLRNPDLKKITLTDLKTIKSSL